MSDTTADLPTRKLLLTPSQHQYQRKSAYQISNVSVESLLPSTLPTVSLAHREIPHWTWCSRREKGVGVWLEVAGYSAQSRSTARYRCPTVLMTCNSCRRMLMHWGHPSGKSMVLLPGRCLYNYYNATKLYYVSAYNIVP